LVNLLYNIFIFPLVEIIEISFTIINRIFQDKVLAIAGVSAVVTVCTMPLYFIAEKWQQTERNIQKKLKQKIDKIKSVFKGDEQYMILSAFYRQNHYHPIYSLRSSLGLLIQIPFFIAAYSYLSHLDFIKGTSFLFINDLSLPDRFLTIKGFNLNILPLIMTAINCISGAVYTRGFSTREKIQIYGMALVFFVLLYNSPAGLVLYWTANNLFSLLKNILLKTKHSLKIVYIFLCICVLLLFIHFIPVGFSPKRLFVVGFCSLIFFAPLFIKAVRFSKEKLLQIFPIEQSSLSRPGTYIISVLILLILAGFVIPGSLIASSVQEFSFLDSYTTPLPFLFTVFTQAFGFFLLWPLCIYFLFSKRIRHAFCFVISLLCILSLVNTFIFPGNYGFITTTFRFSNPDTFESNYSGIIINALVTCALLCVCAFLLLTKKKIIFQSIQLIILASLISFGSINIVKINKDFKEYEKFLNNSSANAISAENPETIFNLSRNGNNVIVLMLDSAISGYVPYIFEEKPELLEDFSGFIYYPNCISFGTHTRIGAPLIFGGYEYKPESIQKKRSYAMEKHNEALLMMPRIFHKENYRITVAEPTFANYSLKPDLSVFSAYPEINAMNIQGNYTGMWLRSHPDLKVVSVPELLKELLLRFSFLKISPPLFRVFIYDKSAWLKPGKKFKNQISLNILDCYTTLDYFPQLTKVSDDSFNTYTSIVNDLTHDSAKFQYPDYVPAMEVTDTGNGPFSEEDTYHVNMASLLRVGKWLRFLQEQGVYDNTRIIIVSDHGWGINVNYQGNIELPDNSQLSAFHALLLVKDFNSRGNLALENTFMTQGDVPLLAMNGLIDNPVNPFSGKQIENEKEDGVTVTTAGSLQFVISNNQWLHVQDNIFIPSNWKKVER